MRSPRSFRSRLIPNLIALFASLAILSLMGCGGDEVEDPNQEEETPVDGFIVGGTASGVGGAFILRNNGGDDVNITEDGAFEFATQLEDGDDYSVTAHAVPNGTDCTIANGSGIIEGADVTDIDVTCIEAAVDPAVFAVAIDAEASTLEAEEGDPIQVVANITNDGESAATQTITMEIGGFVEDSISGVQIAPGATEAITLTWWTVSGNSGNHTAIVASNNSSDTVDLVVTPEIILTPPYFEITIVEATSILQAKAGESIFIDVEVQNTGETEHTQDITLTIAGAVVDTALSLNLAEGDSESFTMEWATTVDDAGTYNALVASEDDSQSISITVDELDPAFYSIAINEAESDLHVDEGDTLIVAVDVENTGDITGNQPLTLEIDGLLQATIEDIAVDGGQTETFYLEWDTIAGDSNFYTADVFSADSNDSSIVSVNDPDNDFPPYFLITINEVNSTLSVDHGDLVTIEVDVENLGDITGTQTIALEIDGLTEDEVVLELDPNTSDTITLEWQTAEGDSNIYPTTVSSEDHSQSTSILVIDPDALIIVEGSVTDSVTEDALEGVEVVLYEAGTHNVAASTFVDADGAYALPEVPQQDYELGLRAPGLATGYSIAEAGGAQRIPISLFGVINDVEQDLTVDWLREKDIYINGGTFHFHQGQADAILITLPGCEETDGNWESTAPDTGDLDLSFDSNECFQINNIAIDIGTGELLLDTADINFPTATMTLDDAANTIDPTVTGFELDFQWLFDSATGSVDYANGSMNLDIDFRFLLGGSIDGETDSFGLGFPMPFNETFGPDAGDMDCQLTGAWGGDVTNPQPSGNYEHSPIQMRLTTGNSGSAQGAPYQQASAMWMVVDNEMQIGRLSESEDPGEASCGEVTDLLGGFTGEGGLDIAAFINNLIALPADSGSALADFEFLHPLN